MLIKKSKGCLYLIVPDDEIDTKYLKLVPEAYQANQQHRDSSNYHITIINSQELPDCSYSEKDVDVSFLNLGLAKLEKDDNEVYYLFIYSQTLNKIRKLFGLEKRIELDFCIYKKRVEKAEACYVAFPINLQNAHIVYEAQGGLVTPGVNQLPGSSSDWHTIQNFAAVKNSKGQIIFIYAHSLVATRLMNFCIST